MFSFTLDIYCTSVRPGRGIPHMWLSLRFLLSFYLLKGFFSSFSLLLLRVKGRGCHTLLKPYETNCGLWIWAIQIKFDWLIDWCMMREILRSDVFTTKQNSLQVSGEGFSHICSSTLSADFFIEVRMEKLRRLTLTFAFTHTAPPENVRGSVPESSLSLLEHCQSMGSTNK